MVNGFRHEKMPSIKCLNVFKCITISKDFTPTRPSPEAFEAKKRLVECP